MATPLLPDGLWAEVAPLLPEGPPKQKGGRPRAPDRACLTGILFALKTCIPWEDLPQEMGCGSGMPCWQRHDLLAAAARPTGGRRLGPAAPGAARPARRRRPDRPVARGARLGEHARPRGRKQTGPNPTDRGKSGSKRHLAVDRNGVPLAVTQSAATVHDSKPLEATVDAIRPTRRPRGRPRTRPAKPHADKGDDDPRCRRARRRRHVTPRIARRGVERSDRLGRHRWVVEHTLARLNRHRRLKARDERRADIHQALVTLACCIVCPRRLHEVL